jgi:CRISPR-associated endonuclease/helicase Cas3
MQISYSEFFRNVTEKDALPYQKRYGRNPFVSTLLVVPTGLGKTDAVLVPWLYARSCGDAAVPTRLVLVLPRQNLTIQTAENARRRVSAAGLGGNVRVLELLGGSDDNDEGLRPDQPAVVVCTQDMYFSRALNRGYARRPPRWPIDFALYNQDCLIVLDEIQLMDDALATSVQLAAFRQRFKTYGRAPCVWMSATVNPAWLRTVDAQEIEQKISLEDDDRAHAVVSRRINARKSLSPAPDGCREPKGCADFTLKIHRRGTRTLVIANTVPRAREIYALVRAQFPDAILLHSRFRTQDRAAAADRLTANIPEQGQIVVSTQVLEAGVDITARALVTDIGPWGSLVQRFGRVNRYGDDDDAKIWWVDQPVYAKPKNYAIPYSLPEVERAADRLKSLTSASPAGLPIEDGPEPWRNVLRKADLLDLFDTTPDLSGNQIDVSRFIRATEDKDAYLAWREWEGDAEPPSSLEDLASRELCPVSLSDLREFIKKHRVYSWNFATEKWIAVDKDTLYAGMLVVTRAAEGGYTPGEGWSPESKVRVEPLSPADYESQGDSSDHKTFVTYRQTLRDHSNRVVDEMEAVLRTQDLDPEHTAALRIAAAKHDWGKAHRAFQAMLHKNDASADLLAKQVRSNARSERKHFRHELASALGMLSTGDSDLAAYLVATHHGKVRLGIRSMPGEIEKNERRTARGIQEGDELPECELGAGFSAPSVTLSLAVMDFGAQSGSWTERMLRLRDSIGPFRLAYLEMLLRAADEEASANPNLGVTTCAN